MARYRGNSHDLATQMSQLGGRPVSVCDASGFMCNRDDMVSQMAYNGAGLYNTGLVVHKRFADQPNPQALTPFLGVDPVPLTNVVMDVQGLTTPVLSALLFPCGEQVLPDPVHPDDPAKDFLQPVPNPFDVNHWPATFSWIFTDEGNLLAGPFLVRFLNAFFQMNFENRTQQDVSISIQGQACKEELLHPGEARILLWNMVEFQTIVP